MLCDPGPVLLGGGSREHAGHLDHPEARPEALTHRYPHPQPGCGGPAHPHHPPFVDLLTGLLLGVRRGFLQGHGLCHQRLHVQQHLPHHHHERGAFPGRAPPLRLC